MILRKNIQQSCEMRCASPSTPASWRMMSWIDLTVLRTDMRLRGSLVERGLQLVDGALELVAAAELPDQLDRRAHRVERRDLQDARVVEVR